MIAVSEELVELLAIKKIIVLFFTSKHSNILQVISGICILKTRHQLLHMAMLQVSIPALCAQMAAGQVLHLPDFVQHSFLFDTIFSTVSSSFEFDGVNLQVKLRCYLSLSPVDSDHTIIYFKFILYAVNHAVTRTGTHIHIIQKASSFPLHFKI